MRCFLAEAGRGVERTNSAPFPPAKEEMKSKVVRGRRPVPAESNRAHVPEKSHSLEDSSSADLPSRHWAWEGARQKVGTFQSQTLKRPGRTAPLQKFVLRAAPPRRPSMILDRATLRPTMPFQEGQESCSTPVASRS